LKKEQTNLPSCKAKNPADKLPEELRENYTNHARKGSAVVENLKVAAALKLWCDRGYRTVGFGVPCDFGEKTFYVDVLARDAGGMVGVECASHLHLDWLRRQVARLRRCLPPNSYLILVFPSTVAERVDRAVELVDEVWVTGKDNSKVEWMMFTSVFHKG
jgi:hypothetical protein